MSSALAVAGVTAVLRDLLNDGMINHDVSGQLGNTVRVTTLPPDRIETGASNEQPQLNLFMFQVTPNLGLRNECLPSRNRRGQRQSNPPLALDLHYLLSSYGEQDLHPDILLGYAMQLFHETPVLARGAINTALVPSPAVGITLPPALRALAESGLADQLEQIRITPENLSPEEMSKIWTATQSNFRPSAAYLATVVIIEALHPSRAALPVLSRGEVAGGEEQGINSLPNLTPQTPTLTEVVPQNRQAAVRLGELVSYKGHRLDGNSLTVLFRHTRLPAAIEVPVGAINTASGFTFNIPNNPVNWIAGLYTTEVSLIAPGEVDARTTNELALQVAPAMQPVSVVRDNVSGEVTIVVNCTPQIRPFQTVSMIVGQQEVFAEPHPNQTAQLSFIVAGLDAGASYRARLRVDGIESILINRNVEPPQFDDTQRIDVP